MIKASDQGCVASEVGLVYFCREATPLKLGSGCCRLDTPVWSSFVGAFNIGGLQHITGVHSLQHSFKVFWGISSRGCFPPMLELLCLINGDLSEHCCVIRASWAVAVGVFF